MSNTITQKSEYSHIQRVFANINLDLSLKFLLVIAVVIVYYPVFSNQFQLGWDDQVMVMNEYTAGGLHITNIWSILTNFYLVQYAPVNQLVYVVIYSIFDYQAFWFHLVSVLIHAINVTLVFGFVKNILRQAGSFDTNSIYTTAFVTAILMAIHPFLVESVAWISALKVLLYSLFYLLAIHYYLKYLQGKKTKYYLLVIGMFILSFGSKEQAVTLPICLLLIDYVLKRDLKQRVVWTEKAPFFILSLFFGYITILSQKADGYGFLSDMPVYPLYQRIIFACYSISEYLVKCIVPVKLSYIYIFPNAIGQPVSIRFLLYPIALVIIAVSFFSFWKKHWVFFGMAYFIIHLALVINIIPTGRFEMIADRYVYLASIGVFFLIAYFICPLLRNARHKNLVLSIGLCYVLLIGLYAHQRSKVWYDSDTLQKEFKQGLQKKEILN